MKRLPAVTLLALVLAACGATLRSAAPSQGLEGTSWTLVEIDGREPDTDVAPTLVIDEDGNISGTAVCNTYMGTATVEGSAISIGPLATTRVACSGAAGLLETAFLTAMDGVEAYSIDSQGRLVLEDGVALVFEPAPPTAS
jgi:heat shock protein HslJ